MMRRAVKCPPYFFVLTSSSANDLFAFHCIDSNFHHFNLRLTQDRFEIFNFEEIFNFSQ